MRLIFDAKQLEYLNLIINIMLMSKLTPMEAKRVLKKMQYKFAGNAKVSFLNGKERGLLSGVLSHRQADLVKKNSITDEIDIIQSVLDKI